MNNLQRNTELTMNGLDLLNSIPHKSVAAVFFDPQYRGVLNHLKYGNEGKSRGRKQAKLQAMTDATIHAFFDRISGVLRPSGHCFLWCDKYHLCQGVQPWVGDKLQVVDMVVWDKGRIGMGYRTRRRCEYLVILQKPPTRAKGVWTLHDIPDVWEESLPPKLHPHQKPVVLQETLIKAITESGDLVVDPAAGSFSVMDAARRAGRDFLGCDIQADEQ